MIVNYEGALLELDFRDAYQRTFIRNKVRKAIGALVGKPWKRDDTLAFAYGLQGSSPVIIDIGCNIGAVSIPVAKRLPGARVIAVDAYPVPLARLIRNLALNGVGNVSVVAAAISDHGTFLKIYPCSGNSGGNRVTGFKGRPEERDGGEVLVPTMSIAQIFSAHRLDRCDLLKVDVEGYELAVLKSAGELLSPDAVRAVIAEYGPEGFRSAGVTGWDLVDFMLDRGYRCRDLHTGKPVAREADIPHLPDFSVTDFLFEA